MNTFEGKNAKTTVGNYQGFATTTRLWRFHRYGGMTATVAAVFGRASALLTIGIGTFLPDPAQREIPSNPGRIQFTPNSGGAQTIAQPRSNRYEQLRS